MLLGQLTKKARRRTAAALGSNEPSRRESPVERLRCILGCQTSCTVDYGVLAERRMVQLMLEENINADDGVQWPEWRRSLLG